MTENLLLRWIQGGLGSLGAYLAAHVLLCLLPAFLIAGGMAALIPKEAVTRFLGRSAPRTVSYGGAALAGSLLAVCSCTIIPLFAGIYRKGAGIGPAFAFLFFAPAANILALSYTGTVLGADLAIARLLLSLAFGIGIGLILALLFRRDDAAREAQTDDLFTGQRSMSRPALVFLLLLLALLLAGTLKVAPLSRSYAEAHLSLSWAPAVETALARAVPYDPARGEEGVTFQGALLIVFLALIGASAYRGLGSGLEVVNRWPKLAAGLVVATLLLAALRVAVDPAGVAVGLTGRFVAVALLLATIVAVGWRRLGAGEREEWLWESWRFVRQIFPLLLVGVFAVGVIRQLIRPEWIEALAGENSLRGNVAGVVFGVFMYFPTLVEVPIANMFLSLGMHRGPLLAYLMADPELSLQSILALSVVVGRLKAWTYVFWVALFSTLAGYTYGAWIDGASGLRLALLVLLALATLAGFLQAAERRSRRPQFDALVSKGV